jgi:hypothetical protein
MKIRNAAPHIVGRDDRSGPVSLRWGRPSRALHELPVVVAQFVVNGAMFLLSFQVLAGGRNFPTPEFGSLDGGYCQCGGTAPSSLS